MKQQRQRRSLHALLLAAVGAAGCGAWPDDQGRHVPLRPGALCGDGIVGASSVTVLPLPEPALGCVAPDPGAPPPPAYPVLTGPCEVAGQPIPSGSAAAASATHLVISTTDFSTGALSVVDTRTHEVERDVAVTTTDAIPFFHGGLVYVLNRYGHDFLDVLDPCQGYLSVRQQPLRVAGVASANPHALVFRDDGAVFVSLYGTPQLQLIDPGAELGAAVIGSVDLAAFADPDGNAELSQMVRCGDTLFVTAQRLVDFHPYDAERLLAVDMRSCLPYEASLSLHSASGRQLRLDPSDPARHTMLVLTEGIERVDLAAAEVTWAVPRERFFEAGIVGHQAQSFAVDALGSTAYVAAYTADFKHVELWRVGLDTAEPQTLQRVAAGLNSVERTMELVGDTLWYGDTTRGADGLRAYDVSGERAVLVDGPLKLGLPPYAVLATSIE